MSSQYVNFGRLSAEFGAPQQISAGFASWLLYCSAVPQRRSTKLCTVFGRLLGWYTMYTFSGGSCRITEFCHAQNWLCVQLLRSPMLVALCTALEQWASAKVCGVVQGMELRNVRRRRHYIRLGGHHVAVSYTHLTLPTILRV